MRNLKHRSHFLNKKKEKKRNTHFQIKGIFDGIRIFDWQTSPKHPPLMIGPFRSYIMVILKTTIFTKPRGTQRLYSVK